VSHKAHWLVNERKKCRVGEAIRVEVQIFDLDGPCGGCRIREAGTIDSTQIGQHTALGSTVGVITAKRSSMLNPHIDFVMSSGYPGELKPTGRSRASGNAVKAANDLVAGRQMGVDKSDGL
jgi:hypothetical protein